MDIKMEKAFKANKNAGYTLIEVVVAVVIIVILSSGAVVSFSSYNHSRIDSAAQKLVLALSQARQEAAIRADGSVRMELSQAAGSDGYAKVIYRSGGSDRVLEEYQICNSRIKLSVKEGGTTTQLSAYPSAKIDFHFKKSTGGLTENYSDLFLEGSETRNIIIIRETGRCFYEP
jgi:prepilin-type N-terminal cleavage/methylation domain-containing protein